MRIGMVGLGRMGANMARRLLRGGHEVVAWNRSPEPVRRIEAEGAEGAASLADLVARLPAPRAVWVMMPAGEVTERMVAELAELLAPGDVLVDGGNSHFHDDVRRARGLAPRGIHYLDVGTSGGVWGLERGYCMMIGGPREGVERLEPIFHALAPGRGDIPRTPGAEGRGDTSEEGWLHCGGPGAGHFVKMVHNGIEYGIMQSYAEGLDILRGASTDSVPEERRYEIDLAGVTELWRRGSVIGSWLLDLTAMALAEDPRLERYSGYVQDSGEGRWTIQAAIEEAVPAEALTAALFARFRSRQAHTFAEKALSAMREKFGGHVEPPRPPEG
ncbi:MAG TPA: decarboxylating 6-phosphogluconate dehydrogenase [Chthonomonadales bacterium]|nr:decarboxylating 6-phosphogluconate dehydrogenase [Chthonomonadales bacterium]